MARLLLSATSLYLLMIGGTFANDVAAGGDCPAQDSNDNCIQHTVCDKVLGKCSIIDGQSCSGNTDKCVSNATCESNVCKCEAAKAIPSTTGLCLLKTGQACTDKSSCVFGAECQTSTCQCSNGFAENTTTKLCAIKHGQSCAGNTDKCVANAACVADVCKCDDTKAIPSTTGLCLLKTGQACTDQSSCVVGAECKTSTCQCSEGFAENTTKLCEAKPGTPCSSDVSCVVSSICESGNCAIKHGQSCAGNTDKCVANAVCTADVCKCVDTKAIPSTTGLCLLKTGQACTDQSSCVVGAECKTSCQCSEGFAENTTTKLCEAKPGTPCSSDVSCVVSSICESGKCAIKHGQSCAGNTDKCVANAACVADVCKCEDTKAIPSTTGLCPLKNKGSNSATLSFWLLLAALMSISLADYVM